MDVRDIMPAILAATLALAFLLILAGGAVAFWVIATNLPEIGGWVIRDVHEILEWMEGKL